MAHYLITGGAGFIGSHLVNSLIADRHQVTVLDNLSSGKKSNVHRDAKLIIGDIRDKRLVEDVIQNVDGCFHLAAIVSVKESIERWCESHSVNLSATINLFETMKDARKIFPVIFASSAAVYGNPIENPISESHPCKPLSPYGADKLSCEMHAAVAWHSYGIPTFGLRLFNVYGPGQDPNSPYSGVITKLYVNAIRKQDLIIYGDGKQTRDFVNVVDVVDCFRKAMISQDIHGQVVNVCTGQSTSIEKLAHLIQKATNTSSSIKYVPEFPGDIKHSCGNIQLANKTLSFLAKNSLETKISTLYSHLLEVAKLN